MRTAARPYIAILSFLLSLALFPEKALAENLFSFDIGFDFTSGDYGTGQTTDTYSTSVSLGWYPTERLDFSLSTTYLYQSSRATTSTRGIVFRRDGDRGGITGPTDPGDIPGTPGVTETTTSEEDRSRSGPGDLHLSAGFKILTEAEQRPEIKAIGYVKIPTANEDDGMGTGEYDYSIGLDVRKWVGLWSLHAQGTAVFQGENDLLQLKDFYTYQAGIGYLLKSDFLVDLSYWGATEPAEGSGSLGEARLAFTKWKENGTGLTFYLSTGLVENSLDYGAGGAFFVNF